MPRHALWVGAAGEPYFDPPFKKLAKRARRGFRGYPIATVAFYGPTNEVASKVVASIVEGPDRGPTVLERWLGTGPDVRHDEGVGALVQRFIRDHGARSVVMSRGIMGCPHEEGVDYPRGAACPRCPFWEGRDRWKEV